MRSSTLRRASAVVLGVTMAIGLTTACNGGGDLHHTAAENRLAKRLKGDGYTNVGHLSTERGRVTLSLGLDTPPMDLMAFEAKSTSKPRTVSTSKPKSGSTTGTDKAKKNQRSATRRPTATATKRSTTAYKVEAEARVAGCTVQFDANEGDAGHRFTADEVHLKGKEININGLGWSPSPKKVAAWLGDTAKHQKFACYKK